VFLIANADDIRLNFFTAFFLTFFISSCGKDAASTDINQVYISKIHSICASAPAVVAERIERGPDFDYGILSDGRGHEVEYYSSSQASHRDGLIVESENARELDHDRIVATRKKYSDGKNGISLSGYLNALDKSPSVKVEYFFSSKDGVAGELAEALAATSRNCNAPLRP
jgi:hypothetical protein